MKLPRWDLDKFARADRQARPVDEVASGEVMGIGASFPEALLKAVRMSDPRAELVPPAEARTLADRSSPTSTTRSRHPRSGSSRRCARAPTSATIADRDASSTGGSSTRSPRSRRRTGLSLATEARPLVPISLLRAAKELGFSDRAIARAAQARRGGGAPATASQRASGPRLRMIDTLAGEWPSPTNYLYVTYRADADDVGADRRRAASSSSGPGPYRIGSSVEFDWSTMNLVEGLKAEGIPCVALLNSNPETVSTDYDRSDRLYFEEITLERVRDLFEFEQFRGRRHVRRFSQLAQNLTPLLHACGIPVLGTSAESIDTAEDRARFSRLLEKLRIPQPAWRAFTTLDEAAAFADEVGYPVLVRPSYVLLGPGDAGHPRARRSGAGSSPRRRKLSPEYPVVITKFIEGADEVELDAISDGDRGPRRRDPRARRAGGRPLRRRDLLPSAPPHLARGPGGAPSTRQSGWRRALDDPRPVQRPVPREGRRLPDHRAQPAREPLAPVPDEGDRDAAPAGGGPRDARPPARRRRASRPCRRAGGA